MNPNPFMSGPIPGVERRARPRYALHLVGSAEVLYRRDPAPPTEGPAPLESGRFRVEALNISTGGFLLVFGTDITYGDILRLRIPLPGSDLDVCAEGRIQWMQRDPSATPAKYLAGLLLQKTDGRAIEVLLDYAIQRHPEPLR